MPVCSAPIASYLDVTLRSYNLTASSATCNILLPIDMHHVTVESKSKTFQISSI